MALREVFARFVTEVDARPLDRLSGLIDRATARLTSFGGSITAGITAVLGGAAIVQGFHHVVQLGDDLGDTAERLNISAQALQEWGYAAEMSGADVAGLTGALGAFQRTAGNALAGNKAQRTAFRQLGISLEGTNGAAVTTEELLSRSATAIAAIEDPTQRAAATMRIFGRSGGALAPLLARGADGIGALQQEFRDLGGGLSEETIDRASRFADTLNRLRVQALSLASRLFDSVGPSLDRASNLFERAVAAVRSLTEKSNILQSVLIVMGGVFAAFAVSVLAPYAPLILLVAVVSDLFALFEGNRSLIGNFLDELGGVGTATEAVIAFRDAWRETVQFLERAWVAVNNIGQTLGREVAIASGLEVRSVDQIDRGVTLPEAQRDFFGSQRAQATAVVDRQRAEDLAAGVAAARTRSERGYGGVLLNRPGAPSAGAQVNQTISVTVGAGAERDEIVRTILTAVETANRQALAEGQGS